MNDYDGILVANFSRKTKFISYFNLKIRFLIFLTHWLFPNLMKLRIFKKICDTNVHHKNKVWWIFEFLRKVVKPFTNLKKIYYRHVD